MDNTNQVKKSTYNAESQKKYNQKFKNIACKVTLEYYADVKKHAGNKGFKSLNSYIISLIDADMKGI